jgi:hypothetical protein
VQSLTHRYDSRAGDQNAPTNGCILITQAALTPVTIIEATIVRTRAEINKNNDSLRAEMNQNVWDMRAEMNQNSRILTSFELKDGYQSQRVDI